MAEREPIAATGALITWLILCGAAVCAAFMGTLSSARYKSFFEIENSYRALVMAQVFFIIFLLPFFERKNNALPGSIVRLLGLMLVAIPLVAITRLTQELVLANAVLSQLLVFVFGISVAAVMRLPNAKTWYYPAIFLIAVAGPFVAYMLYEQGRVSTEWAAIVTPFWAALSAIDGARWPLVFNACLAIVLVLAAVICRRKLSASR